MPVRGRLASMWAGGRFGDNSMSKKYTVMIFDAAKLGRAKSISISTKPLWIAAGALILLLAVSFLSSYLAFSYYRASHSLMAGYKDDSELRVQLDNYAKQLDDMNKKIAGLDELEYKVRDLVSYQNGDRVVKQVAVGGKEVDILRDYFAASDRKEQEFFDNLNETLLVMSVELDKREMSLTELVDFLEEQRLIMLSTPTIWPVRGWISSQFGFRTSPFTGRRVFHEGLDIAAQYGLDVHATAKGIVVFAGEKSGYGNVVTIDHGYGYMTRYGHNSRLTVKVGDKINKGDVVAKVGSTGRSTGPHCHYEVLVNGIPVNPLKFIIDEKSI